MHKPLAVTVLVSIVAMLLLAPSTPALAQEETEQHLRLDDTGAGVTAESFAAVRKDLLAELDGEKYSEITPRQRAEVEESLGRMTAWLELSGSVEAMNQDQRVRLHNEQERINTTLTGVAADSQMVCSRDHTVGTRMRRAICFTVAERRRRNAIDSEEIQRRFLGPQRDSQ